MAPSIERRDANRREIPERRAKQAIALGHMRYVLAVSFLLAVTARTFQYLTLFH